MSEVVEPPGISGEIRRCTRCVMHDGIAGVVLDAAGVCNHCHLHEKLDRLYPLTDAGHAELLKIVEKIKRDGRG